MGSEFGQFIEWDYQKGLDWLLLEYPAHRQLQLFFRDLNRFYRETPSFWEVDYSWEGFGWISNDDYTQSVIAFRRMDKKGREIIAVCNFVPVERTDYRIGVPVPGLYAEVFSTDQEEYGGGGIRNGDSIRSEPIPMHGCEESISLHLPPLSVLYLRCRRKRPVRKLAEIKEGKTVSEKPRGKRAKPETEAPPEKKRPGRPRKAKEQ